MRNPAVALLTFLAMTGNALPAPAQSLDQARLGFVAAHDQAFKSEVAIPAAHSGQQTHWKEGFIIGTVVGALVVYKGGVVGIDRFTPRVAIGLTALGSLIGGVPGALIGGQFPKGNKNRGNAVGVFMPGYENQWTACADWSIDVDQDGLDDNCEYKIAYEFRPLMSFLIGDEVRREPRWAAEWLNGDPSTKTIRVAYLHAYWMDMGDAGTSFTMCTLLGFTFSQSCHGHAGDSEFIRPDVKYNDVTQHWFVAGALYSAHTNNVHFTFQSDSTLRQSSPSCSGAGCSISYPSGKIGHYPLAFASDWKHANYPSDASCDAGGPGGADDCSTPRNQERLEVVTNRNIGSRAYPSSPACVPTTRADHPNYGGPYTECFWSSAGTFNGWFYVAPGGYAADPYGPRLYAYFGF